MLESVTFFCISTKNKIDGKSLLLISQTNKTKITNFFSVFFFFFTRFLFLFLISTLYSSRLDFFIIHFAPFFYLLHSVWGRDQFNRFHFLYSIYFINICVTVNFLTCIFSFSLSLLINNTGLFEGGVSRERKTNHFVNKCWAN